MKKHNKLLLVTALTLGGLFSSSVVFASEQELSKLSENPEAFINTVQNEGIDSGNGFIVVLKDNQEVKNQVINESEVKDEVEVLSPTKGVFLVDEIADVEDLVDTSEIKLIYKDEPMEMDAVPNFTPKDPLYSGQWALSAMKTPFAWKYGFFGSSQVKVAVIDSGIFMHPDFNKNNFILNPLNDVSKVQAVPLRDISGHGTSVTGVIAAQMNNIGIAGATPNVKIVPIRTFDDNGDSWTSNGIRAVERAMAENVDVINMSYSSGGPNALEEQMINDAVAKGIIVVASSGNIRAGQDPNNPGYRWPASFDNVISVGSVDKNLQRSSFSFHNDKVDVVAPGGGVTTTDTKGGYVNSYGTSFSSPYVASFAAFVKSIDKNITPAQFKALLQKLLPH